MKTKASVNQYSVSIEWYRPGDVYHLPTNPELNRILICRNACQALLDRYFVESSRSLGKVTHGDSTPFERFFSFDPFFLFY